MKEKQNKTTNVFFAVDDNYAPYLSVVLESIKENAAEKRIVFRVLNTGLSTSVKVALSGQMTPTWSIEFVDVTEKLDRLADKLFTRDYYTNSTYYRLFVAEMFPDLDSALYLDADIVLLDDVTKLASVNLGKNLVGACADGAVANNKIFCDYVEKCLGVPHDDYFNAGVLLMNLKEMRETHFEENFVKLLQKYRFTVAQDQDYLNVLCKGKVKRIPVVWNTMPIENSVLACEKPHLVHFNMHWKPWLFPDVKYRQHFWKYAATSPFFDDVLRKKASRTQKQCAADLKKGENLIALAIKETYDTNNYLNLTRTEENNAKQRQPETFGNLGENLIFGKKQTV